MADRQNPKLTDDAIMPVRTASGAVPIADTDMNAQSGVDAPPAPRKKTRWKQDPEAVKADILRVATEEFAANGLSGGRIDEIARRTTVSKRMIYYYFGDKEGLYRSVLENVYKSLRGREAALDLTDLDPVTSLERLLDATFESHVATPEFIRLVMIENIHDAQFLKKSDSIPDLNRTIIERLEGICARGKAQGLFYPHVDPLELHWVISSLSFYNVSNKATFSCSFGPELYTPEGQSRLKKNALDMVLRSVVIDYTPRIDAQDTRQRIS